MSVFDDVKAIEELEGAGSAEEARGGRIANAGRDAQRAARALRDRVEAGELPIGEAAEKARAALDHLQTMVSGPDSGAVEPPKPARKTRSDAGKPRAKGSSREGRTSPLTDELRRTLLGVLQDGPKTLAAITAEIGGQKGLETEDTIEGLLCEDSTQFAVWRLQREGDKGPVQVWGTMMQLVHAVGRVSIKSSDRVADTAAVLGCSVKAARDAWNYLDPKP